MKKPTEKQIEAFVRHPEQLTESETSRIKSHLASDEELRLIAEWFLRFYEKLDEYVSSSKKAALEKGWIPTAIDLKPITGVKKNGRRVFVLAAQTDTADASTGIEQIRTFASKKYSTLIRILRLKSKQTTKIDVISDHIDEDDIVILSVPGTDIHLVTQPGGKLEISSEQITGEEIKEWKSCRVNLPVLKTRVNRRSSTRNGYLFAKSTSAGAKSIEILQRTENVEIYPDQTEKNADPRYMVLSEAGKLSSLWDLKEGKVTIPKEKFHNREVSLFFYN